MERYYGIIEQLDELSTISENTYKTLVDKYGYDKFLEIEKNNPSCLTNFYETASNTDYEEDIKKYLVLKNWQDKQHIFAINFIEVELNSEELEGIIYDKIISKIDIKTTMRRKFEIHKLISDDFISIDKLSCLYSIGLLDDLKTIIGGKAYGLAILNCFYDIPKTYVISHLQSGNSEKLIEQLDASKTFAVRSSADCEDNSNFSFAGMFDSFLNINKDNVLENIQKVKDSVNSNRVKYYIETNALQVPKMNVIVQEFIDPDYAGVWMASSINDGVYEIVEGCGESLVGGKKTPLLFNFNKNDDLSIFFVKLQTEIGSKCDFEFCIKDNIITMLQCRPEITSIKKQVSVKDGIGASSGKIEGEICFLESPDQINDFKKDSILLTYLTDPDWVPIMEQAKGIITKFGGYLCHAAIISRELNKPCIVGVNANLFNKLKNSTQVIMDASNGEIKIIDDENTNL